MFMCTLPLTTVVRQAGPVPRCRIRIRSHISICASFVRNASISFPFHFYLFGSPSLTHTGEGRRGRELGHSQPMTSSKTRCACTPCPHTTCAGACSHRCQRRRTALGAAQALPLSSLGPAVRHRVGLPCYTLLDVKECANSRAPLAAGRWPLACAAPVVVADALSRYLFLPFLPAFLFFLFVQTLRIFFVSLTDFFFVPFAFSLLTMPKPIFDKVLVANRGEIACRVMKTCRRLGIKTVAVYSTADEQAKHVKMADEGVCIGAPPSVESYLRIDKIVEACKKTGAQAVHPGYGFLSENFEFQAALQKNNIVFIGPDAHSIQAMGDKIESKRLAKEAGVTCIPGFIGEVKTHADVLKFAKEVGYPVMIKASGGGGGKGMRVAYNDKECTEFYDMCKEEAMASFNSDRMLVEKFIENPRHIEIQVIADRKGHTLYLPERECSIQRRNQKVIEEAPSVLLDAKTRKAMGEEAVAMAKAVQYVSAGTVENVVNPQKKFFFLEMNTRLQVEHPITEEITGVDLVEQMLRAAADLPLSITQDDIKINGHATEARVYAEDPMKNYFPSIGRLSRYEEPTGPGVRCDSGIIEGSQISVYYDPLICKLTTWGKDRTECIHRMEKALDEYVIRGLHHNVCLLRDVLTEPTYLKGDLTTNYLPEKYPDGFKSANLNDAERLTLFRASACAHFKRESIHYTGKACNCGFFQVSLGADQQHETPVFVRMLDECTFEVSDSVEGAATKITLDWKVNFPVIRVKEGSQETVLQYWGTNEVSYGIQMKGTTFTVNVLTDQVSVLNKIVPQVSTGVNAKEVLSPMPGVIVALKAQVGQSVVAGEELLTLEAMKMRNKIHAVADGKVKAIKVKVGDTVEDSERDGMWWARLHRVARRRPLLCFAILDSGAGPHPAPAPLPHVHVYPPLTTVVRQAGPVPRCRIRIRSHISICASFVRNASISFRFFLIIIIFCRLFRFIFYFWFFFAAFHFYLFGSPSLTHTGEGRRGRELGHSQPMTSSKTRCACTPCPHTTCAGACSHRCQRRRTALGGPHKPFLLSFPGTPRCDTASGSQVCKQPSAAGRWPLACAAPVVVADALSRYLFLLSCPLFFCLCKPFESFLFPHRFFFVPLRSPLTMPKPIFDKVLVANRGEIACRVSLGADQQHETPVFVRMLDECTFEVSDSVEGAATKITLDWKGSQETVLQYWGTNEVSYGIQMKGTTFTVNVLTDQVSVLNKIVPQVSTGVNAKEVLSPMPGVIVALKAQVGQSVVAGEELLTLEAMKMRNKIHAVADGKVKAIKVKVGDTVEDSERDGMWWARLHRVARRRPLLCFAILDSRRGGRTPAPAPLPHVHVYPSLDNCRAAGRTCSALPHPHVDVFVAHALFCPSNFISEPFLFPFFLIIIIFCRLFRFIFYFWFFFAAFHFYLFGSPSLTHTGEGRRGRELGHSQPMTSSKTRCACTPCPHTTCAGACSHRCQRRRTALGGPHKPFLLSFPGTPRCDTASGSPPLAAGRWPLACAAPVVVADALSRYLFLPFLPAFLFFLFVQTLRIFFVSLTDFFFVPFAFSLLTMPKPIFDKVLVANRGEIACRVMKTCRRLGIKTVAVYSTADEQAKHVKMADEGVCIGAPPSVESYLRIDKIVEACKKTGAQAVHPGYGFLSENFEFQAALQKNNIVFIGPDAHSIQAMGDKIESKRLAKEAGVTCIPGFIGEVKTHADVLKFAKEVGYPVMIKASGGGGGKGMRVAYNDKECTEFYDMCKEEAMASFNSDRMLVEKFIENPRHIEIQCSIQRRNQKVIEEAPSVLLDAKTRKAMGEEAVAMAKAVQYVSAGTVENVVNPQKKFFFLEMNTRLQVEHPITEEITGVDLVEQMLRAAADLPLSITQDDIKINGHATEARVYAEDPMKNYFPSIGRLSRYEEPTGPGVRCDSGIIEGSQISVYYDPLICKLTTWGKDRTECIHRMEKALDEYVIRGLHHNVCLLRDVLTEPTYLKGDLTTNYLPEKYPDGFKSANLNDAERLTLFRASACAHFKRESIHYTGKACNCGFFQVSLGADQQHETPVFVRMLDECTFEVSDSVEGAATKITLDWKVNFPVIRVKEGSQETVLQYWGTNEVSYGIQMKGTTFTVNVLTDQVSVLNKIVPQVSTGVNAKEVLSPMPGVIVALKAQVGQSVVAGEELLTLEAMKMRNKIHAVADGKVKAIKVKVGDTVEDSERDGMWWARLHRVARRRPLLCFAILDSRRGGRTPAPAPLPHVHVYPPLTTVVRQAGPVPRCRIRMYTFFRSHISICASFVRNASISFRFFLIIIIFCRLFRFIFYFWFFFAAFHFYLFGSPSLTHTGEGRRGSELGHSQPMTSSKTRCACTPCPHTTCAGACSHRCQRRRTALGGPHKPFLLSFPGTPRCDTAVQTAERRWPLAAGRWGSEFLVVEMVGWWVATVPILFGYDWLLKEWSCSCIHFFF
eukprot:gene11598-7990_t